MGPVTKEDSGREAIKYEGLEGDPLREELVLRRSRAEVECGLEKGSGDGDERDDFDVAAI